MIYICTHKNSELKEKYKNDDTFQNNYKILNLEDLQNQYKDDLIMQLHPYLNEWVGQYYAHEYLYDKNIVGFCHYRRIIDYDYINFNRIKNTNGSQFFCIYNENIDFYEIDMDNKKKYCYVDIHGKYWDNHIIYNDFVEYNDCIGKNFIDINYLDKIMNVENVSQYFWHPSRQIYVTTHINFDLIFNYIYNFVKYIIDKYNIYNKQDFEKHIISEVHNNHKYEDFKECKQKLYYWRTYAVFIEYIIGILLKYYCKGFGEFIYDNYWKNEQKYFCL